jgi:hypothetical protein
MERQTDTFVTVLLGQGKFAELGVLKIAEVRI